MSRFLKEGNSATAIESAGLQQRSHPVAIRRRSESLERVSATVAQVRDGMISIRCKPVPNDQNHAVRDRGNNPGRRDRQNPRPNHTTGDPPLDGRESLNGTDSDDRTRNRVRRADRNPHLGGAEECHGSGRFGAGTAIRPQLGDFQIGRASCRERVCLAV